MMILKKPPARYSYIWLEALNAARRTRSNLVDEITGDAKEQDVCIMGKIPAIHSKWFVVSAQLVVPNALLASIKSRSSSNGG